MSEGSLSGCITLSVGGVSPEFAKVTVSEFSGDTWGEMMFSLDDSILETMSNYQLFSVSLLQGNDDWAVQAVVNYPETFPDGDISNRHELVISTEEANTRKELLLNLLLLRNKLISSLTGRQTDVRYLTHSVSSQLDAGKPVEDVLLFLTPFASPEDFTTATLKYAMTLRSESSQIRATPPKWSLDVSAIRQELNDKKDGEKRKGLKGLLKRKSTKLAGS